MADSLVMAGIELLGDEGGVPSAIPECAGAIFALGEGYDLSSPQRVATLLTGNLLDGQWQEGRTAQNRTLSIPVKITGTDRGNLAAAREILLLLCNQDTFQLVWTRDGGQPFILDCYSAGPSQPDNNLFGEQELVSYITITCSAAPYGRADSQEQVNFPAPSQIWDQPATPVVLDTFGTAANYLQGDDAGFEASAGNWVASANATVARSTAQHRTGVAALAITAVGAGAAEAVSAPATAYATKMFSVRPGSTINVSGWLRAAVTGRSVNVGLDFYDANGTQVGARLAGSNVTDTTTGFTQATATVTAPSGALWAAVHPQVLAAAAGETHYLDDVSLDAGPVYSYTDNWQWSQSAVTPIAGQSSAKWTRAAQDYPVYDHILPAPLDLTGRTKLTFMLGLGTYQGATWKKGTVHFSVTLTDSSGAVITFGDKQHCAASSLASSPHWQLVTLSLLQQSGFNYAQVARYSIAVWNLWDSSITAPGAATPGQPVLQASAYLAAPTATGSSTGTSVARGIFATLPGTVGTARAPMDIQAAPGPSSFSTVVEFNAAGSNPFTGPALITKVDKAETWGGGGGGAGRPSLAESAPGGGGGGAGEYAAEYNIPITAGNSYPATVGAGGAAGGPAGAGSPGGDSRWAGQSGPVVYAHGGMGGWKSTSWGGSKGGTGSGNAVAQPGGNGHQSNASGDHFGGGGGSSGDAAGPGKHPDGRKGAAAVGGGGPGGDGGLTAGGPADGQPPSGPPGGGGGGGAGSVAGNSSGGPGIHGRVRLTYGAAGILPLVSLFLHMPSRDAPPAFNPIIPVGGGGDTPNGATEYTFPQFNALNARYNGSHTVYLVNNNGWNTPGNSRTLTLTFRQYAYVGATAVVTTLTRTLIPSTEIINGYVDMGPVTLPIAALTPGNTSAYFTVAVTDTITADRFYDVIICDSQGSTLLINIPAGGPTVNNIWVDSPEAGRPAGEILGSDADRDRAVSLAQYVDRFSGPPFDTEPGAVNRMMAYAQQGLPSFIGKYMPRYWIDRMPA